MHPYVKLHKLLRFVLPFAFIFIMILHSANSCSYPIKKIKIFSLFTNGYLRIEGNKVVADMKNFQNDNGKSDELYKVTIFMHYHLFYHIKSMKFICWNKAFTKLVGRRNPPHLKYCKFEEKTSVVHPTYATRYTTPYERGNETRETEIRFDKNGSFAKRKLVRNCLNQCTNADFLPREVCASYKPDFCAAISKKIRHKILKQLQNLCKTEWY